MASISHGQSRVGLTSSTATNNPPGSQKFTAVPPPSEIKRPSHAHKKNPSDSNAARCHNGVGLRPTTRPAASGNMVLLYRKLTAVL